MGVFREKKALKIGAAVAVFSAIVIFIIYKGAILNKQQSSSFISYEQKTLPSGWDILFFEDKSLPYIKYSLFLPYGGSLFNSVSKNGLAKFTLSLLDQGAGDWTSEEIQEKLNYYGTELDIKTGRENAKLVLSGLSFHGEELWELFYTIITKPRFLPEEAKSLKEKFTQSRLQSLDDKGYTAYEVWLRTLFPKASLGLPVSGTVSSVQEFSMEDIKNFYEDYIIGGSKILVVTGNFENSLQKKIISSLKSGEKNRIDKHKKMETKEIKNSSIESPAFHFLTKSDLSQSEVLIGFPMKSFPKDSLKEYFAFGLGNEVFGGMTLSSRLMVELRGEQGLTYGVYSIRTAERDYGFFLVEGNSRTKATDIFLKGILSLLKDLKEKGITQEELNRAKIKRRSDFLSQIEIMENRVSNYIYYRYGLRADARFLDNYLNFINEVTLEEVNQALKENIHWDRLHILVYGHPGIKGALNKVRSITHTFSFEDYFSKELSWSQKKEGI